MLRSSLRATRCEKVLGHLPLAINLSLSVLDTQQLRPAALDVKRALSAAETSPICHPPHPSGPRFTCIAHSLNYISQPYPRSNRLDASIFTANFTVSTCIYASRKSEIALLIIGVIL